MIKRMAVTVILEPDTEAGFDASVFDQIPLMDILHTYEAAPTGLKVTSQDFGFDEGDQS